MDTIEPANEARLQISRSTDPDGVPVLALRGELDIVTAAGLADALETIAAPAADTRDTSTSAPSQPDAVSVVIDLSQLEFMDSSGLAVLVSAVNRGYRLRLRQPIRIIRDVIAATGLSETLPVEP